MGLLSLGIRIGICGMQTVQGELRSVCLAFQGLDVPFTVTLVILIRGRGFVGGRMEMQTDKGIRYK